MSDQKFPIKSKAFSNIKVKLPKNERDFLDLAKEVEKSFKKQREYLEEQEHTLKLTSLPR